ncbi:hypothetical protein ColLi_02762 [Colletotrichum liriopes]|uniref:Uncharacterized protein n=1 Tax=Colletotrichum liriopes TaxID=708192 RepID=A0AA37GFT6_9PEZI|nr:hypothetical protein ColLi_02762 [Colletotrichum liriopes]
MAVWDCAAEELADRARGQHFSCPVTAQSGREDLLCQFTSAFQTTEVHRDGGIIADQVKWETPSEL